MECTKTDSLQHCQQYRLRLTPVHLLELAARHCNALTEMSKRYTTLPSISAEISVFLELCVINNTSSSDDPSSF